MNKNIKSMYYLTPSQEGMLFHVLKDTYCNMYFGDGIFTLKGDINISTFEKALEIAVERNDVFRTRIVWKKMKRPVQVIVNNSKLMFDFKDLRSYEDKLSILDNEIEENRNKGISLGSDNLYQFRLYQLEEHEYVFVFGFHHIILDGWCVGILAEEIFDIYNTLLNGNEYTKAAPPLYSNYVHWLEKQNIEKSNAYWKKYLDGISSVSVIHGDINNKQGYLRKELRYKIGAELYKSLVITAKKCGVTLNVIVDAIWGLLLQKYNYSDDVVFGTVVSGRNAGVKDAIKMIGLFINTLPLRVKTAKNDTFTDLVQRIQADIIASNEFEYASLKDIQKVTELGGDTITHLLAFQNFPLGKILSGSQNSSINIVDWKVFQQTNYDLCIEVMQDEDLEYYIVYNANKYSERFMNDLMDHVKFLFEQIILSPVVPVKELQILRDGKKKLLLNDFGGCSQLEPVKTSIVEQFENMVRRFPDKKIISKNSFSLTYSELDKKSEALKNQLIGKKCRKGDIVGILANDSIEMITGIMAILKAGAAYLPIEPSYPFNRKKHMLEVSDTKILLRTSDMTGELDEFCDVILLDKEETWDSKEINAYAIEISPDDLAYVIFTSGTTNQPKGVMVSHKSVVRLVKNTNYIEITPDDRILKTGSIVFDASTFEIWVALLCGAELFMIDKETLIDSSAFYNEIKKKRITILWLTTSLFNQLVDENIDIFSELRYMLTGGDVASIRHFNKVLEAYPQINLINAYGPTENTTFTTTYLLPHTPVEEIHIGKPLKNTTVYILDRYGNMLDTDMPGQLCTGGEGVAVGYLRDEALTAERYVDDILLGNGKMYLTGDLAVWRPDGNIGFIGRIDKQLKIRGFRVSLSEIEDNIRNTDKNIKDVVAVCIGEKKYIYAFVTCEKEIDIEDIKFQLRQEMPEYMIPQDIIILDKIPSTINGKADKNKLAELISLNQTYQIVEPTTELEKKLTEIWKECLQIAQVGVTDNFFELGGDSISAMGMISSANKYDIDVNISDLYKNSNIRDLASFIERKEKTDTKDNIPKYEPDPAHQYDDFALNEIQMAYLMGRDESFELGGFSTHYYAEFESELDIEQFEKSINKAVAHHPMLRAVITENGMQHILEKCPYYKIKTEDISLLTKDEKNNYLIQERKQIEQHIFPLGSWPMFNIKAYKLNDTKYQINFGIDVLVVDGASLFILASDIKKYYFGQEPDDLKFTFRDYLIALNDYKKQKQYDEHKKYWLGKIDDFSAAPALPLAVDPSLLKNAQFSRKETVIPKSKWDKIKEAARLHNVTAAGLLCTLYAKILSHWSGQDKLCINTTVFKRYGFHEDVDKLIGDFTCIILLDIEFNHKEEFWEQVKKVQNVLGDALSHSDFSGVELSREITKKRGSTGKATMPYIFTCALFEDAENAWDVIGEMKYAQSRTPQVYLDNQIIQADGELSVVWDYPEGLFESSLIEEMFENYIGMLDNIIENEVPVINLSIDDLRLVTEYNETNEEFNIIPLQKMFSDSAKKYPERTAVSCAGKRMTYSELDVMSNKLANALKSKRIAPKSNICVLGVRCIETIANILAVLKYGCTYIPINPEYPEKRQEYIIQNSNSVLFLTPDSFSELNADDLDDKFDIYDDIDSSAYVIYTSGSTGEPKGVVIEHKAVANTLLDLNKKYEITCEDKIIGLSSMGFDLSVYDIFGSFLAGAELVLVKDQKSVKEISDVLKRKKITVWNSVPAIMEMFIGSAENDFLCGNLKHVWLSGDWIPLDLPEKITKTFVNAHVISMGGATEASIWSIYYPIDKIGKDWKSIPYGYPLANQKIYILDQAGEVCPSDISGEIYIGGAGVAKEYLNDTAKTNSFFIEHPKYGRIYRTGDYGRMKKEGYVEFLGRKDSQVKIRGFRIEFGEIEAALNNHGGIQNSVVDVYETENGNKQLIGYIVADESKNIYQSADNIFESMKMQMQKTSVEYNGPITLEELKHLHDSIEKISTAYIYNNCVEMGMKEFLIEKMSSDELMNSMGIISEYSKLFKNWLDVLTEEQIIVSDNGKYLWNKDAEYNIDDLWSDIENIHKSDDLKVSFGYLKQSGENHIDMLQGKVNALSLFFPDGSMVTAENLYKFSPIAVYLNNMIQAAIKVISSEWSQNKVLRVLEIGAGTGGTTDGILPLFDSENTEYTFTDVSKFFIDQAKIRYEKYDFIKYGLLDINEDMQSQGYRYGGYDLIICANVVHDAANVSYTLNQMKKLLDNNGIIALIEGTSNSRQQLATVRFIEGLSKFEDERTLTNQPLLSVEKWKNKFEDVGIEIFAAYPEDASMSELFGNHLIISRKCNEKNLPHEDELKAYLSTKIPEYMIPSLIFQIDNIPLSANGKVNRKMLVKPVAEKIRNINFVPPVTKSQKILADIWSQVLHTETIGIKDNFYDLGGDSLKAVEIVSKAEKCGISISLAEMFAHGTIAELSEIVDRKNNADFNKNYGNIMLLREGNEDDKELFLIHAGSGEVGGYVELCKHLDKRYKCWAFHALERKEISPENIDMKSLADTYIKNLNKVRPHGPYNLIGWCVGGTIAFEIASQLEKQGDEVRQLILINSNAPSEECRKNVVNFDVSSEAELIKMFAQQHQDMIKNKNIDEIWETVLIALQKGLIERDMLKTFIPKTILRVIPNNDSGDERSFIKYINRIRSYVNARDHYIPDKKLNASVTYIGAKDEKIDKREDWQKYVYSDIDFCEVNGSHVSIFEEDNAYELGVKINEKL